MAGRAKICGLMVPRTLPWRPGTVPGASASYSLAGHGGWTPTGASVVDASDGVPVLGVFGMAPLRTILDMIAATGLSGAQLHEGGEADLVRGLEAAGVEVWEVARFNDGAMLDEELIRIGAGGTPVLIEPRNVGGGGRGIALAGELALRRGVASASGRSCSPGGCVRRRSPTNPPRRPGCGGCKFRVESARVSRTRRGSLPFWRLF